MRGNNIAFWQGRCGLEGQFQGVAVYFFLNSGDRGKTTSQWQPVPWACSAARH